MIVLLIYFALTLISLYVKIKNENEQRSIQDTQQGVNYVTALDGISLDQKF